MNRTLRLCSLLAAVLAAGLVGTSPADAHGSAPPAPDTLATGLVGPLQLDIGHRGQVYVAQSFAGQLSRLGDHGNVVSLASETVSVEGVASRKWAVAYTTRNDAEDPASLVAELKLRRADGSVRTVADLAAYEAAKNPDQLNRYGFRQLGDECLAQLPPELQPYTGQVDSNPYALANAPGGGWFVADAGANAILHVSRAGKVSTYFVFRPQKSVISAEAAAANGLPDCTVGATFAFEPVPTDVEVNAQGYLLTTLLPGGPEDASLGARGSLVRIGGDGEYSNLASGFLGATNLAIGQGGRIYVAELFGGQISMYRHGVVSPVLSVPSPAGLEYRQGRLYASTDVFGAGNVVSLRVT